MQKKLQGKRVWSYCKCYKYGENLLDFSRTLICFNDQTSIRFNDQINLCDKELIEKDLDMVMKSISNNPGNKGFKNNLQKMML